MAKDIIVIAGSAGALQEVRTIIAGLPRGLAAAVFVVLHTSTEGAGMLAQVIGRAGIVPVTTAQDGEAINPGHVYVGPPNHHLLLAQGRIELGMGPRENGFRPAADALFRTAAQAYGARVVGVILSGALDDGMLGMMIIKDRGGIAIVQDPDEALYPSMPRSAIQAVEVDYILPAGEISPVLRELTNPSTGNGVTTMKHEKKRQRDSHLVHDPAKLSDAAIDEKALSGPPTPFICPQCGGALWRMEAGKIVHYRCHVGHGYTAESLLEGQDRTLEDALWVAYRTLEDTAALRRRMARDARERRMPNVGKGYDESAHQIEQRAGVIREVLLHDEVPKKLRGFENAKPTKLLSSRSRLGGETNGSGDRKGGKKLRNR